MSRNPGFERLVAEARPRVREAGALEVAARLKAGERLWLVDIREDDEWRVERARGALHLGRGVLERDIEARIADPGAAIVLYCAGGMRSVLAAESLARMGYTKVESMAGGFRAWREAGLPIESASS